MGWVTENFKKRMHLRERDDRGEQGRDDSLGSQANRKWTELLKELQHDTDEFRRLDGKAEFKQPSQYQCRISNAEAGVALLLAADMNAHSLHYEYEAEQKNVAVPEGGFLSLRSEDSGVAFYSADQQLTTGQACRLLLEPFVISSCGVAGAEGRKVRAGFRRQASGGRFISGPWLLTAGSRLLFL